MLEIIFLMMIQKNMLDYGDFGPKRPGIPEQKDQTFRCMKTKFSGPKRPTYPHFQALAV
jgi:hypothetical protein